ncbi:MAG: small basic protein [Planctomycetes bacterium]|nr:small basic protein [Planctomycetota bacterium]
MTIHKSLRVKSSMTRSRNVWKRLERVMKLEEDGKFADGRSVFGLPKVKTRLKVKAAKGPKKEAAAGAADGKAADAKAAPAAKAAAAKPAAKGGK